MSKHPRGAHRGYLIHLASRRTGSRRALRTAFSRDSNDNFILDTQRGTIHPKKVLVKSTSAGKSTSQPSRPRAASLCNSSSCHSAVICHPGPWKASVFPRSIRTLGSVCMYYLLLKTTKAQITIKIIKQYLSSTGIS